jgi:Protein of unknown function (DUF3306)
MEAVSENEAFLVRWSRRKRQAEKAKTEGLVKAVSNEDVSGSLMTPELAHSTNRSGEPVPELSAEEIALLPRVEDLTAETDVTQFLRKGVPMGLRNAALRRMWALDPAIRDYVSEAREYAYDWNVPEGVPGSGPLLTQDVDAMVRRITSDGQQPTACQRETMVAAEQDGETPSQPPEILSHDQEERSHLLQSTSELVSDSATALDNATEPASHGQASPCDSEISRNERIRRHGSAMPT